MPRTTLGEKHVIGPTGLPLSLADLPLQNTQRWVIRRKAEVVAAVRGGLLSLEDACSRYSLSPSEFLSWQWSLDHYGLAGLRTTSRGRVGPKGVEDPRKRTRAPGPLANRRT
jgi:hypothetical protein